MNTFRPRLPDYFQKHLKDVKSLNENELKNMFNPGSSVEQWIVFTDNHVPFQNRVLEDKALKLVNDLGTSLDGIVLGGDFLDLYTLGSYNADSLGLLTGITLEDEYNAGLISIDKLERASHKGLKKKYLFGNHEDRYFREVNKKDNAKYGAALKHPIEALELDDRGWEVKTNWKDDYFTLGEHLDVMHGMFTNIHAAYQHLQKTHQSCIFGHTHRVQSYNIGNRAAYNVGGMYDIKSSAFHYMPRLTREIWANGFARVYIDDNGYFFVEQVNVWNNTFFTNGKLY